jgi:hypothetical protein
VAFSLLAGACSQQPDAVKQKEARDAYAQLARGDYAGFEARLSPEALAVSTPADRQKLYAFAKSNVPTEAPKSVATVSWQVTSGSAGSSYALLDDYEYQSKYIEVTTVLKRDSGSNKDAVAGFHFNVINKNQVADRSLIPKTLPQFALSAAAAAALLVTLVAMVQVFTRKGVKRYGQIQLGHRPGRALYAPRVPAVQRRRISRRVGRQSLADPAFNPPGRDRIPCLREAPRERGAL